LTPGTLILAQVVALVGFVMLLGAYLFLTDQRAVGLLLMGTSAAINGVLLERLANSLPRRPFFPRAGYRVLIILGVIIALLSLVELLLR
jgi:hypothetical protein